MLIFGIAAEERLVDLEAAEARDGPHILLQGDETSDKG